MMCKFCKEIIAPYQGLALNFTSVCRNHIPFLVGIINFGISNPFWIARREYLIYVDKNHNETTLMEFRKIKTRMDRRLADSYYFHKGWCYTKPFVSRTIFNIDQVFPVTPESFYFYISKFEKLKAFI